MPQSRFLQSTLTLLAARLEALRAWGMEPTPSPLPALTQRDHAVRPWIAVLALVAFLGSQCLMPGLLMMDAAQAKTRSEKGARAARIQANESLPAPAWYQAARRREAQNLKAIQQRSARLAQAIRAKKPGDAQDETPSLEKPPGHIDGSKPGKAKPSEASDCKDCEVEMTALDLSRAPTEKELRQAGQLGGALSPISPADYQKEERELALGKANIAQQGRKANAVEEAKIKEKEEKIKSLKEANLSFGVAIQEWNKHNFQHAAQLFAQHVKEHPDSPWLGEAQLHLGCDAKYNGRFTEAEAIYQHLYESTSSDKKVMSFAIHQKAKARWADLDMARGRLDDAAAKLRNIIATDTDWRRITWAQSWLGTAATYKNNARDLRACGTEALSYVLASLGKQDAANRLAQLKPSGSQGFTLAELERLASQYGEPMRGFKATPEQLANLPMPLIAHLDFGGAAPKNAAARPSGNAASTRKGAVARAASPFRVAGQSSGHFLVVREVDAARGIVNVYDPQERRPYALTYRDFDKEWSGTGLLLSRGGEGASEKAARLSQAQMKTFLGGCCGTYTTPPGNGGPGPGTGDDGDEGGGGGGGDNGDVSSGGNNPVLQTCKGNCPPYGSPSIAINLTNLNTVIQDIPMWYSTARGPDVEITMTYNAQDAVTQASPFGNKWTFNYASYVVEDTATGGGRVTVFRGDGSQHNYTPDGNGGYTAPAGVHNTLTKNGPTSYVITTPGGGKRFYEIPSGTSSLQPFLVEARDRFDHSLKFIYNSNVKLIKIKDAHDKITNLTYDAQGHIIRIVDPFERVVTFSYDAGGNMIEAVDMEGQAFQYTYDSNKYVTQLNTAQGPWLIDYKPGYPNNDLKITDPMGGIEKYHWEAWGNSNYSYTDKRNNVTGFTVGQVVGGIGKITQLRSPDGSVTNAQYDPVNGGATRLVDARGMVTTMTYNALGKVLSVTEPRGGTTNFTYSDDGLKLRKVVNALGQIEWTAIYNDHHQLKNFTNALNQTTTFSYMAFGGIERSTDAAGQVVDYNYDMATKNLLSVSRQTPNGTVTLGSYSYDDIGRVKTASDTTGFAVSYTYNNLDQVTRVAYPDGTYEATEYVCCGTPGVVRDRSGRKSYFDYDGLLRLARMQDAQGNSVQYEYDPSGNMTSLTDSRGTLTRWSYDNMDRPLRKTYNGGAYAENGYYKGLLTQTRGTRGQMVNYAYDDNDNLTLVDYANANMADIGYVYDALDRVTSMTDGLGTTSYGYDALSRPTSEASAFLGATVSYAYDVLGRRSQMTVSNSGGPFTTFGFNGGMNGAHGTTYGYDALDRLNMVSDHGGGQLDNWTFQYIGNTDMVSQAFSPNGTRSFYTYDSFQRLTQVQNNALGALQSQYAYTLDNAKSIRTGMTAQQGAHPVRSVSYAYDTVDQLTGETQSEATLPAASTRASTFAYDAMGNRTSHSFAQSVNGGAAGVTNVLATHNRLNQITAQSSSVNGVALTGTNFFYDASGNMTAMAQSNGGSTYLYDDADRLVSITQKDTATGAFTKKSEYVYDGEDRRVVSREYSWDATLNNNAGGWNLTEEKRRVYDGMDVVQERDANNAETVRYTRAGNIGGLLGRSDASGDYFYHYDGSGNVVALTDTNQNVVAEYAYDAWGNTLRATGAMAAANTYRYSTKEYQAASGLYDYGFRFYSPGLGRWINRDPIREAGGLNVYGFVDNDPVNTVDEDGLSPLRAVRDSLMRNGPAISRWAGAAGRYIGPRLNPNNYSFKNGINNFANAANRVGQWCKNLRKPDPWVRNPSSLQDRMTLDAAKRGAGNPLIRNLGDRRYKGMEKWEYKVKSRDGRDSVVHYVTNPKNGKRMDFKFKKRSGDGLGDWERSKGPTIRPQ